MPKNKTYAVQLTLIIAIQVVFSCTSLGQIYLEPAGVPITLAHLPVIIATLFLGWKSGTLMGFIFALLQLFFLDSTHAANYVLRPQIATQIPSSFAIQFIPKLIFPFVIAAIFGFLDGKIGRKTAGAISAFVGISLYSFLTFGGVWLFFHDTTIASLGWVNAIFEVAFGTITGALAVSKIGLNDKKKIDWKWAWKRKSQNNEKPRKSSKK